MAKVLFLLLFLATTTVDGSVLEWFWPSKNTGNDITGQIQIADGVPLIKVPYEATTDDEKFLQEAKKYTSLKLSELDSCQHMVVMKIRSSCSSLTEEELAKMSVNLLNCQSGVEGRQQFPCTDRMSLRECTSPMDSDMWNTYHLMNNRARAVCYAARHQQFRALSEMTVNKLMNTAHDQLASMNTLKEGQVKLESLTMGTLESVSKGHESLMLQQRQLRSTQQNLQDFVALNLRELTREKALIAAGHRELSKMTADVKQKLEAASSQLSSQANESKENHKELLNDLNLIQDQANLIWERIERSTEEILLQHASAAAQYEQTLEKLGKINTTVNFLLQLLDATRQEVDDKLSWITDFVGGTGDQLNRLYSLLLHIVYLLVGMVAASFLRAPTLTRACLLLLVPLNLAVIYHHGPEAALNFPCMSIVIVASVAVQWLVWTVQSFAWKKQSLYIHGVQPQPMFNNSFPPRAFPQQPEMKAQPATMHKLWTFAKIKLLSLNLGSLVWKPTWFKKKVQDEVSVTDSSSTPPASNHRSSPNHPDESSDSESSLDHHTQYSYQPEEVRLPAAFRPGTPIMRHRTGSPSYFSSPPTPSRTPSRSGTPRWSEHPKSVCQAMCLTGQKCRNVASPGEEVCYRHLDSLDRP